MEHAPPEIGNLGSRKYNYFRGTFSQVNATENAVVSILIYPSLEFSVSYNKKLGKTIITDRGFTIKGRDVYPLDVRILLQHHQSQRPCACECAKLLKSSISHLSWYFVRVFSISSYSGLNYARQCKLTQDTSTMLSQQHELQDRIEGA